MANSAGFVDNPIETAAAPPSQTAAALTLPSTVRYPVDPLWWNDPWADRSNSSHRCKYDPGHNRRGQSCGRKLVSHSCGQHQLAGPPQSTLQETQSNDWQSPLPPPPNWDATAPGLVGGDNGRQDDAWTGWNPSRKGYNGNDTSTMEITDRDPVPKFDFQEPDARLKPWLRELSFWRHDTKYTYAQAWCQVVQSPASRNDWSELGRSSFCGSDLSESRV